MDEGLEEITIDAFVRLALDARLVDVHTSMPAIVSAYDPATQTVDVVPACNRAISDGAEPPNWVSEPLPKLAGVRVGYPKCGKFTISFPLVAGDTGLLIFAERNIGNFRATGQQGDPGDLGMHTLDGAIFLPCDITDGGASAVASSANMVIGSEAAGASRIEIKPTGGGNLGAGATKGIARNGDSVKVTIPINTFLVAANAGVLNAVPIDVTGTVTAGSTTWKATD